MYTLTGKEEGSEIGCFLGIGIALLLTTACLFPLLFPNLLSTNWSILYLFNILLLFVGLGCLLVPFSDRRTAYLFAFMLVSCILLQLSMFQLVSGGVDNYVKPVVWSIQLRFGYVVFLFGLFIFTFITYIRRDSRTRENFTIASLSVSEERVTFGKAFFMHMLLSCKKATPVKSIRIIFSYYEYSQLWALQEGHSGYVERTLPIYEKREVLIDPVNGFAEDIRWTIPASLVSEDGTRKNWSLKVRIVPRKGVILETTYPLKVKWEWAESA